MMRTTIRSAIICALAFCSAAALARVEIEPTQYSTIGSILAVKVSEDIAPGDYEALIRGIRTNPGQYARRVVILDNIGGSVVEAIKMGRLLRELGFEVLVPSTAVCQGSCVYLLAAGHKRTVRGFVGIHRPYFPSGDSAQADETHNGMHYNPGAYFREMNIPSRLFDEMQSIEPRNMRVLTSEDLARFRLN